MVKKFMAALLAAALFLCSFSVFAEFVDGDVEDGLDIQPFSYDTISSWTDTFNFIVDSNMYVYARVFEFESYAGGYNNDDMVTPVYVQLRYVNNTDSYYKVWNTTFDLSTSVSVDVSLQGYDFGGVLYPTTISRLNGNSTQRWVVLPQNQYFVVGPGETYFVEGTILYSSAYVTQLLSGFEIYGMSVSLGSAQQVTDGATAGGQQAIEDAINDNHQDTVDQFEQATNPDQAQATTDVDNAALDLESFEDGIFTDINTYKADLDFSLDSWVEASAGLDYVRKIFMVIWNNSPSQIIVLSLMLGLAMYLLGRGPAFQRAEAAAARRERRHRGGD